MDDNDYLDDWRVQFELGIEDLRMLYGVIDNALEKWPGAPQRPYEEQEFLRYTKNTLFALITEYNFTHNEHK